MTISSAFTYWLLGLLGLSFAISPGYASPIFPAAGFAVAILLWSDGRAWFGIWLGSFALNVGVAVIHGKWGGASGLMAAGIASGASVQAQLARYAILKFAKEGWRKLENERDILRILVLGGPVACLFSATVGCLILLENDVIAPREFLFAWWSWWSGDTFGVLVVFPLALGLLYRSYVPWRGRLTSLFLPMLMALLVVSVAFRAVVWLEQKDQRAEVRKSGEHIVKLLEQRFIAHQEAISALRRLLEVTPDMTYQHFEHFTKVTLSENPDIFALSINPLVASSERIAFERLMARKTNTVGFEIRERDSDQRLIRAGDRPDYVCVGYIAPLEGNRPALGYDIYSEPLRHQAIQEALESGLPSVTAPIQLVQESQKRTGVLLLHPARRLQEGPENDQLRPQFIGLAVGVVKLDQMVEIALKDISTDGLVLEIRDAKLPAESGLLYRTKHTGGSLANNMAWEARLAMANRAWSFEVLPTQVYLNQSRPLMSFAVGAVGLLLAALLQVLLLVITGRTSVVQRIVDEQTDELRVKSQVVEDRNAQLNALFLLSPDAFVAFDLNGKVKFANPAFEHMTGIARTSIVDSSEEVLNEAIRAHCHDPSGFAGVSEFFDPDVGPLQQRQLILRNPRHAVLKVIGIHSESSSVSRILYLRDITHETEVDRMKSEFLSHAAHELRTPMTSVYGYSELLMTTEFDEATRKEMIEVIHRQTKWLIDIINELLDLARIDARRGVDVQLEEVDVYALIFATVADISIDQSQWPLVVELPTNPIRLTTDRMKLRRVLINLLDNAVKYSPAGGGICIKLIEDGEMLGIRITDKGIGMTPEQVDKFGERFWRADVSGSTAGAGLGIAIVREIIDLLRGRLEISSALHHGTTITIWLPQLI